MGKADGEHMKEGHEPGHGQWDANICLSLTLQSPLHSRWNYIKVRKRNLKEWKALFEEIYEHLRILRMTIFVLKGHNKFIILGLNVGVQLLLFAFSKTYSILFYTQVNNLFLCFIHVCMCLCEDREKEGSYLFLPHFYITLTSSYPHEKTYNCLMCSPI